MQYRVSVITVLVITISFWSIGAFAAGLGDGLVGYWPLDDNGNDESGNGNNATLEQGAKWTNNGWIGGALEVDGAGGHAVVDNKFKLVTTEITVAARINGWKTIDWSGIVVGRSDTTFWMGVAANNTLTYVWNNNAAATWGWEGAPQIPQDKKKMGIGGNND